jgi:outer membrane protein TolC
MRLASALALALLAGPLFAARPLSLEEAQQLAAKNNRNLQLARLKVQEAMHKRAGARADYFPKAAASATDLYFSRKLGTTVTAGELGLGFLPPPFPSIPVPINLVKQDLFLGGITVGQPLTQLVKIQQEVRAATSGQEIAAARSTASEDEVRYAVEQLYYALLVSQRQRQAAESKLAAAEQLLADAQNAVETGNALKVASIGRRAGLLEARQNLLAARDLEADYSEALNLCIGLPATTDLAPAEPPRPEFQLSSADEAVRAALERSLEVREARASVDQARAGVRAARADYIPEVTALVQYFHQAGIPTLPDDFGAVGGTLTYTLFDFGKRRELVRERETLRAQADENLRRVQDGVEQRVRKSYRNVERALQMVDVARESLELRRESERLTKDQFELGLALKSAYAESQAAAASSDADMFRAEAGWRLAVAELKKEIALR